MTVSTVPRESAGGIILNPDGRLVLVRQNGNSWSFPKGGVEEGETLLTAARREIREETGLTELILQGELGSYERNSIGPGGVGETTQWGSRKRTFFLFTTPQRTLAPQDDEVSEAVWIAPQEALAMLTHPKDREFLESVLEKIRTEL